MSKELEQLANLVKIAEHDRTLDDRFDDLYTIAEYRDDLKAILARMEALEKVYSDARQLTLRGARTTCRSITEIVENVNGHEWNWLLESLAEVPK